MSQSSPGHTKAGRENTAMVEVDGVEVEVGLGAAGKQAVDGVEVEQILSKNKTEVEENSSSSPGPSDARAYWASATPVVFTPEASAAPSDAASREDSTRQGLLRKSPSSTSEAETPPSLIDGAGSARRFSRSMVGRCTKLQCGGHQVQQRFRNRSMKTPPGIKRWFQLGPSFKR